MDILLQFCVWRCTVDPCRRMLSWGGLEPYLFWWLPPMSIWHYHQPFNTRTGPGRKTRDILKLPWLFSSVSKIFVYGGSQVGNAGNLLVILGFWIFRFSIISISVVCKICLGNLVVRYRGHIIKVSWIDPGQYAGFWGPFLVHWNFNLP